MAKARKDGRTVVVRLTPEEAKQVWLNADGWMDAGACEGGLEPEERAALDSLCNQITRQIHAKEPRT